MLQRDLTVRNNQFGVNSFSNTRTFKNHFILSHGLNCRVNTVKQPRIFETERPSFMKRSSSTGVFQPVTTNKNLDLCYSLFFSS